MTDTPPTSPASADLDAEATGRPGAGAQLSERLSEAGERRAKRRDVRPLGRLFPYLARHKLTAVFAVLWLLLSTAASLGLTVTARGAIDHGFENDGQQIGRWFLLLGANALFLGLATAVRYFYVTKTGERMIADMRTELSGESWRWTPPISPRCGRGRCCRA